MKTKLNTILPPILLAILLTGCATFYTGVVTVTSVVDAAMKDWAALSVAGKTTPALDEQVKAAHEQYRIACGIASDALKAYKASADSTDYVAALSLVRESAGKIIEAIAPLLANTESSALKANLAKASAL